jgi:cell division septation protein DedD
MYHFTFNRLRLFVMFLCLGLLGLLSYAAGVVTGIGLWMPTHAEIALLKDNLRGGSAPALRSPETAAASLERAAATAPGEKAVAGGPMAAAAPPATPAAQPAAPANPSPFAAMAAPLPVPAPAPQDDVFSVQLGVFRDSKNAQQLVADLKQKGYPAIIFTALDEQQREWHVVRIPGFKTLDSAAGAAANFTNKERLQAIVRRSAAL